ncbi:hypothetical protein HY625_02710 [Candidatus Uhrbacteria bacterium]|nr:hypothetical protein [Candidatus Uhrbacteria bacterium]
MPPKALKIFFSLGIIAVIAIAVFGVVDTVKKRNSATSAIPPEVLQKFLDRKAKALQQIKEKPDLVIPYVELSTVEKALGNLDAAIAALVRASDIAPTNYLVFSNLGVLYSEKRMNKEADIAFQRALQYGKNEPQNYVQYAEFLSYRYPERKNDILATYEKGLQELKGDVNILKARAAYYRDTGDDTHALADWKAVLQKDPANDAVKQEILQIQRAPL